MHSFFRLMYLITVIFVSIQASAEQRETPILVKGRIRPLEAYAEVMLRELGLGGPFVAHYSDPLELLWQLHFRGYVPFKEQPLFQAASEKLKEKAGLDLTRTDYSYDELIASFHVNSSLHQMLLPTEKELTTDFLTLSAHLSLFASLKGEMENKENPWSRKLAELRQQDLAFNQISAQLEQAFPLLERVRGAGVLFKLLPSKKRADEWFSIGALGLEIVDARTGQITLISNFTRFSDPHFDSLQSLYLKLKKAFLKPDNQNEITALQASFFSVLQSAHQESSIALEESPFRHPSPLQLKAEIWYLHYPWVPCLLVLYAASAILLGLKLNFVHFLERSSKRVFLQLKVGYFCFTVAFLVHTVWIGLRGFILERPPVSNMFETLLYVPWFGALVVLLFPGFKKYPLAAASAALAACLLLLFVPWNPLNPSLEQLQPVLNSRFWLIVHVLMIVGSYGVFLVAAILAHLYLIFSILGREERMKIGKVLVQTLYIGIALLIPGTLLGGVWAAESWGRFWDWDPKEAWAFISSCVYLIAIHAFRMGRIHYNGLAMGALAGFLSISFTWYGVNYILGTGLHSYGFGSGGQLYYWIFVAAELGFMMASSALIALSKPPLTR